MTHPEPVTDDDEFSECQNSMFIFQIPRLVRNWDFEQNIQTFPKKQTMVLFSLAFLLCLLLEWTESTFDFPPYFFPLFFCRKVKISEVCKNCSTKPLSKQQNNFWKILSGKEEARTRRHLSPAPGEWNLPRFPHRRIHVYHVVQFRCWSVRCCLVGVLTITFLDQDIKFNFAIFSWWVGSPYI